MNMTHNAMARVLSGRTTMSGVSKNHKIAIKGICVLSIENDINLLFDLGQMVAIMKKRTLRYTLKTLNCFNSVENGDSFCLILE